MTENETMEFENQQSQYSNTETDVSAEEETETDVSTEEVDDLNEGKIEEEEILNYRDNLLYKEIVDIITNREKSDKSKLEAISKKYIDDPKSFYESLIDFNLPTTTLANSLQNKYRFLYSSLSLAIKFELPLTVKFLLSFPEVYFNSEKIVNSLSKSTLFLKNREIHGKNKDISLFSNVKFEIFRLNSKYHYPLIVLAVKSSSEIMVKLLIDEGADLNIMQTRGTIRSVTALGMAINIKNLKLFKLLINHPDIDLHKAYKNLHFLNPPEQKKKEDLVEKLLNKIGDFETYDNNGYNLLHNFFLIYKHNSVMDFLLEKKEGNINSRTSKGNSFLHIIITEDLEFSRRPRQIIPESRDFVCIVKLLLDRGIDINAQNEDGDTALHLLIAKNEKKPVENFGEKIEYLLKNGANLNLRNNSNKASWDIVPENAKIFIKRFGFFNEIKNIIVDKSKSEKEKIDLITEQYKKNPNLFHETFFRVSFKKYLDPGYVYSLLSLSIKNNFYHLTEFLLYMPDLMPQLKTEGEILKHHFSKIILISKYHRPLLDLAIEVDMTCALVELLINYGCQVDCNLEHFSALESAIFYDNKKAISRTLIHKYINVEFNLINLFLKESLTSTELDVFLKLLTKLQDLEKEDKNRVSKNFFHKAASLCQNNLSMENFLLKFKPDLEKKTKAFFSYNLTKSDFKRVHQEKVTPLHVAFSEGSPDTVQVLLSSGAMPDSRSSSTLSTPFDYTIRLLLPKNRSSNRNSDKMDLIFFRKLERIGFWEKTEILLKNSGNIYSDSLGLGYNKEFFDQKDIMRDYPNFWEKFDSILQSIFDEFEQQKLMDVSLDDIKPDRTYLEEDFQRRPTKRQRC